jgi:hypothetical protein
MCDYNFGSYMLGQFDGIAQDRRILESTNHVLPSLDLSEVQLRMEEVGEIRNDLSTIFAF